MIEVFIYIIFGKPSDSIKKLKMMSEKNSNRCVRLPERERNASSLPQAPQREAGKKSVVHAAGTLWGHARELTARMTAQAFELTGHALRKPADSQIQPMESQNVSPSFQAGWTSIPVQASAPLGQSVSLPRPLAGPIESFIAKAPGGA